MKFYQNIYKGLAVNVIFKSMETLCCHSNQTKERNFIKNTKPVMANMVTISIKSQPHTAYGF